MSLTPNQRAFLSQRRPQPASSLLGSSPKKQLATLSQSSRIGGLIIIAPSGWGKSIFLGKFVVLPDALHGMPQVVIDVGGQTTNNFLHALLLSSRTVQHSLLTRILYCDMAGRDGFV